MDRGESSYRRYLDGDESAFEELVKDCRDPLTFFLYGFVRDWYAAEDIAIDTFAEIAYKKNFNFKYSFSTYLYTVGRSRALDYLRRRKRRAAVSLEEAEPYLFEDGSVEEDYIKDEEKKELHRAIGALPEKQRTVIHLIYFEALSYEETARVMGVGRKAVDNLLYRAKEALRSALNGETQVKADKKGRHGE